MIKNKIKKYKEKIDEKMKKYYLPYLRNGN